MIIQYNQSQDITLKLIEEEKVAILNGPTNNFFDIHTTSKKVDLWAFFITETSSFIFSVGKPTFLKPQHSTGSSLF